MDPLSLLCNLHADGPATLHQLRRAGLRTLSDVAAAPPGRIEEVLGATPAFARRLAREAGQLGARMVGMPLDAEEGGTSVWAQPSAQAAAPPPAPAAGEKLRPGLFAGLDEDLCRRLAEEDVITVEALAQRTCLALARRLGVAFTRLLDVGCLAQARVQARAPDPRRARDARAGETVFVLRPAPPAARPGARPAGAAPFAAGLGGQETREPAGAESSGGPFA